jgi:carbon-monoxide dehydrogenase small subunit
MEARLVTLNAGPREKLRLSLNVNGEERELLVEPYKTLLELLREDLALTGTKHGCELGECGACAVLLDGELVLSCLVPAVECGGRSVTTVEALRDGPELHPLQAAFADHGAAQCGYCTPGMLVAGKWLLDRKPDATRDEIAQALAGQLCRCTGYLQIYDAVESAGRVMRGLPPNPPKLPAVDRGHSHD